ncbi:hypothetical protein DKS56_22095 [Salmonella enterica subsp. enterica serovar Adelaide]|nr:hypothetical protein [Salmonella enterica subsp. enterica serovar Adelaide]
MNFFIAGEAKENECFWEFRLRENGKPLFKNGPFKSRIEAIENLEIVIPQIGKSPFIVPSASPENRYIDGTVPDDNALINFLFIHDGESWSWECKTKEGIVLHNSKKSDIGRYGFSCIDDAIDTARALRKQIEFSRIVDASGVRLPDMYFTVEFANKYNISDDHPSRNGKRK